MGICKSSFLPNPANTAHDRSMMQIQQIHAYIQTIYCNSPFKMWRNIIRFILSTRRKYMHWCSYTRSQMIQELSSLEEMHSVSLLVTLIHVMAALCSFRLPSRCVVQDGPLRPTCFSIRQSRTWPSLPPLTIRDPCWDKASAVTVCWWAWSTTNCRFPDSGQKALIVQSSQPRKNNAGN